MNYELNVQECDARNNHKNYCSRSPKKPAYIYTMFTGIIEAVGVIKQIETRGTNKTFVIETELSQQFKIDQSISHSGVCLTVEKIEGNTHYVTAIEETLKKTSLDAWQINDAINIERCMQMNGRLDGHIVQGHVDATAVCTALKDANGSWEFMFEFDKNFAPLIIEKGSVAVNGISLTAFNVNENCFTVAIIPYTYYHTNISKVKPGSLVNIEFDMLGKYISRHLQLQQL